MADAVRKSEAVSDTKRNSTDIPVGEILRRARVHYNQSLYDIERALRIRADQLDAIERGDLEKLPGRFYAMGFVRTYSEYLGLDGDKMIHLFKVQSAGKIFPQETNVAVIPSENKMPRLWLVGGTLLLACVVAGLVAFSQMSGRAVVETVPPVPSRMKDVATVLPEVAPPAPAVTPPSEASLQSAQPAGPVQVAPAAGPAEKTAEPLPDTVAEAPKKGIILNILENSWVEIRDQTGKVVLSRVLQAGDQYFVPDRPDLFISIGNAGGVQVEVDGAPLKPLGAVGDVRRNLRLDAQSLKRDFALPQQKPVETQY